MAHEERVKKHKKSLISFYKFSTKSSKPHKTTIIPPPIDKLPLPTSETIIQCNNIDAHIIKKPSKFRFGEEEEEEYGGGSAGKVAAVAVEDVEGGRRSVSYVETTSVAEAAAMLSVRIVAVDMPGFMQSHAFRCARRTFDSLEKFSSKHMAFNLKKEFDKVYGPAWHCIVGSSFGSFVTHSTGCFLYFSMEKVYILLFRTKVRRAID